VLSAAVLMTQGWLDVPWHGWLTMVVTDGTPGLASEAAAELAEMCWERRHAVTEGVGFLSADASVDRALACPGKPVVIADGADATTSGACGDSTHLLRAMLGRSIPDGALTFMVDPASVDHAREAGVGGAFEFAVGGKRDNVFSRPLGVRGRVLALQPARYVLSGHWGNSPVDMGMSAAVRVDDVTLLLVEHPGPGSTPSMYRCAGLEPRDFKIVIVKSPAGFRANFESFAAGIILSDCPGCASPRFAEMPFQRINRPLWPLDDIDDRHDVQWVDEMKCE
jgi:microcystin degradation protein MlrC